MSSRALAGFLSAVVFHGWIGAAAASRLDRVPPAAVSDTASEPNAKTAMDGTATAETAPAPTWYGGQTLAVDLAALALGAGARLVVGDGSWRAFPYMLGGAAYLFGGPIVHGLHGQGGRAAGSFGMRIALPAFGALAGVAVHHNRQPGDPPDWFPREAVDGFLIGAGVGAVVASAVDAIFLAREPARPAELLGSRFRLLLSPSFGSWGGGGQVAAVAAF
jgi:hypothetical protein